MRGPRALILLAALNALLLVGVVFVLLRAAVTQGPGAQEGWHGTAIVPPMTQQPFALQSADGPLRSSDLHGGVTVLFFGYTNCPDACPLTLARLAAAHRALSPRAAAAVRVVLVSVDPERDSVERLENYVSRFDTTFTGVTGTRAEIEALARAYGIHHAPEPAIGDGAHDGHDALAATEPVIAHTTHVLVLDPAGRLALLWSPEIQPEQMVADLQRLLRI